MKKELWTRRHATQGLVLTGLAAPMVVSQNVALASEDEDRFDALGGTLRLASFLVTLMIISIAVTSVIPLSNRARAVRLNSGMRQRPINRGGGLGQAPIRRRFRDAEQVATLHLLGRSTVAAAPLRQGLTDGIDHITFAQGKFEISPNGSVRDVNLQAALSTEQIRAGERVGTLYRTDNEALAAIPPHDDLGFV